MYLSRYLSTKSRPVGRVRVCTMMFVLMDVIRKVCSMRNAGQRVMESGRLSYTYIYIHVYTYTYIWVRIRLYVCVHIYKLVYVNMYICY